MQDVLKDLVGQRVQVYDARGTFTDKGVLVGYDSAWIRLDDKGETLCFPLYNVRLVKLLSEVDRSITPV